MEGKLRSLSHTTRGREIRGAERRLKRPGKEREKNENRSFTRSTSEREEKGNSLFAKKRRPCDVVKAILKRKTLGGKPKGLFGEKETEKEGSTASTTEETAARRNAARWENGLDSGGKRQGIRKNSRKHQVREKRFAIPLPIKERKEKPLPKGIRAATPMLFPKRGEAPVLSMRREGGKET